MQVAVVGFRPQSLMSNFQAVKSSFPASDIMVCCQEKDRQAFSDLEGAVVFSQQEADAALGYEGKRGGSIGHYRNLLQLCSLQGGKQPLVMLDDDIVPNLECNARFEKAFSNYDFVQGSYTGCMGNGIYMLVKFFEFLENWEETPENLKNAQGMLSGVVKREEDGGLRGAVGGLLGLSPALLCSNAFLPTSYPFDDHFYEFSSRYLFRNLKFMGPNARADEIPTAAHHSVPSGTDKLVSHYVLYVKSAIVENYCYFCLSGAVPQSSAGGKLAKLEKFDAERMCTQVLSEAAFGKLVLAAQHYLQQGMPEPIVSQLQRIPALSFNDFFVPQEELEGEWEEYAQERGWLSETKKKVEGGEVRFFQ